MSLASRESGSGLDDGDLDLVFVIPGVWASGGFRTLYQWMNRLVAAGSRVRLLAAFDGVGRDLLDARVEVHTPSRSRLVLRSPVRVPANRLLGDRSPWRPAPRAVLDLLPSDGQLVTCWAPWLPQVRRRRASLLYAQHWEPVWFAEGSRQARLTEAAMHQPVPTIVNSSWLMEQFPQQRREQLRLVFPGVDLATFSAGDRTFGRPDGPLHVVALGRPDPLKGLAELREAVSLVSRRRPVRVTLFGTAERGQRVSGSVTETSVGALDSTALAELYRQADVVATPSWYESFPLPPLEAMACGVPVVTTRPGTEDFANDGDNALVVPARDVEALAAALLRIAEEPELALALARSGAQTATSFTWDAGYAMFLAALHDLLPAAR